MKLIEKLKRARRVSAPLVSISTSDQQAVVKAIAREINGDGTPIVAWDILRGTRAVNDAGRTVAKLARVKTPAGEQDVTVKAPVKFLELAEKFPEGTIAFVMNADRYLAGDADAMLRAGMVQGLENLRDELKQDQRMLILLSPGLTLPDALVPSFSGAIFDDPAPTPERLREIITEQDKIACDGCQGRKPLDEETLDRAVASLQGLLSDYGAEQAAAMSMTREGFDLAFAMEMKKTTIEQTRGLTFYAGGSTFDDLGGLQPVKDDLTALMTGAKPPDLVVWIDEIEKTGLTATGDSAGVNSDAEGTTLSWLEDSGVYGIILVGVPGAGKSALCKAVGAQFQRPVIRLDMGALQGKYVGESQDRIRTAFRVIDAMSGGNALVIATSNKIEGLSSAMRSRFSDVYFFDLLEADEREPIWRIWLKQYGLDDKPYAKDDGWVGRNIQKCCEKAYRMGISIAEAGKRIIPVADMEREGIEGLRAQAEGRYLSASKPGVYRQPERRTGGKRAVKLGVG